MRFSVIVPIYGVEPYLRQCVDSILEQTLGDLELILVDDGSQDGCPAICDAYAARDPRVRVVHKANGGLVSARQAGMELARGDYVVNVDGDDWIAPDLLERAERAIQTFRADLVTCAVTYVYPDREETVTEPVPEGLYEGAGLRQEIGPLCLMASDMRHMFYYLCGKAIRRDLLYAPQMAVDRGISLGEDVTCLMPVYQKAERAYVSAGPGYFCRCREGSDSRSFRLEQFRQSLLGIEALERMDGGPDFEAQVHRYVSFLSFSLLVKMIDSGQYRHLKEMKAFLARPELRRHITAARFRGVTPKMRVVYFLFRRGWTGTAFWFLRLCKWLKRMATGCH